MATANNNVYALLTPRAHAGIAVLCVEGLDARNILQSCFSTSIKEGRASHGKLHDGSELIDDCIISQLSATRLEICPHGSPAIIERIEQLLQGRGFSRENACCVSPEYADFELISRALTTRSAVLLSRATNSVWREFAQMFPTRCISESADALSSAVDSFELCSKLLNPPRVVISGPPNAGKSTLFNRLTGYSRNIVSTEAGTTHDVIGEIVEVNGFPIRLYDSPGIGGTGHFAELLDVTALNAASEADLVISLCDATAIRHVAIAANSRTINVLNKVDLLSEQPQHSDDIAISATSGQGIQLLLEALANAFDYPPIDAVIPELLCPSVEMRDAAIASRAILLAGNPLSACETIQRALLREHE